MVGTLNGEQGDAKTNLCISPLALQIKRKKRGSTSWKLTVVGSILLI